MPLFQGRVHSVIYEDAAKAFYILKMVLDDDAKDPKAKLTHLAAGEISPTVRGHVPGIPISIGAWFAFEGSWKDHEKYGKQIVITKAPILKNGWDPDTSEKMLASHGISARIVAQIRQHFGDKEFTKALGDVDRLQEVPGLAKFSAMLVVQRWTSVLAYFQGLAFLNELGLPSGKVRQVWGVFGEKSEKVLSENPWALVEVEGITFQQADEIAMKMGLDLTSTNRTRGAVLYACKTQRMLGHTYLNSGQLSLALVELMGGVSPESLSQALIGLHKEKLVILDRKTRPGVMAIYEPWSYEIEVSSSQLLHARMKQASFVGNDATEYLQALAGTGPLTAEAAKSGDLLVTARSAVEEWGAGAHLNLAPQQEQGIINALVHPVSILTGLPGTGKTTSLRAAVRILQEARIPFLLCAPTGIAAKRLASLTNAPAFTIHRAFAAKGSSDDKREATYSGIVGELEGGLGATGQGEQWGYGKGKHHPARVIIIDESSMVDQHLLYRILDCTAPNCRIVFVGDHAQLPSVGPGNVLRSLIASGQFPVIKLTDIFRQADTSGIVFAAHAVHRGEMPDTTSSDFTLLNVSTEETAVDTICKLAEKLYSQRANFQILSPRHSGAVGVTALNSRLRDLLNPKVAGIHEIKLGNDIIREDDRVMIVQNNYKLQVFNGDVGKVTRIDRKAKTIEVRILGDPPSEVSIPLQDASKLLRLAYACTVHKAQGLEYDHIVIPVVGSFRQQLQRNLYYTAITRAKKRVFLVGTALALRQAVLNAKEDERNTLFLDRLLKDPAGE